MQRDYCELTAAKIFRAIVTAVEPASKSTSPRTTTRTTTRKLTQPYCMFVICRSSRSSKRSLPRRCGPIRRFRTLFSLRPQARPSQTADVAAAQIIQRAAAAVQMLLQFSTCSELRGAPPAPVAFASDAASRSAAMSVRASAMVSSSRRIYS